MKSSVISSNILIFSFLTSLIAIAIGVLILNPLWVILGSAGMHRAELLPPITAPVDGIFYLHNAQFGYDWSLRDPYSLWFHPLLSSILSILPTWVPLNLWFWILSILFGFMCLPFIHYLANFMSPQIQISGKWLPFCLVAPGGLGIATGNAEFPTLFLVSALVLSVLRSQNLILTFVLAFASVFTKPNALYMVPLLLVYFGAGLCERNPRLWIQALIGIVGLLGAWLIWILIVDWHTGYSGAYWEARDSFRAIIAAGDPVSFFERLASAFLHEGDLRDQIRYSTALLIPLVNFFVLGIVPLSQERHRYAMAAGNLAMLGITIFLGNPNKVLVYTTTLPGYFVSHLLILRSLMTDAVFPTLISRVGIAISYGLYCIAMVVVFALGTPLMWYH